MLPPLLARGADENQRHSQGAFGGRFHRIPLVQEMVEEFFGIAPFKGLNPDEVVPRGRRPKAA